MKYTFEIMKEYEDAFKGISVYSVSEDKKLMVDFVALEELEDAQKEIDEAYQRGLVDAWEAARKIVDMWKKIDSDELLTIFDITEKTDYSAIKLLFDKQTAAEAISKLKAYEEKQKVDEDVKCGDEVEHTSRGRTSKAIFLEKVEYYDEEWYRCLFYIDCEVRMLVYPKSQFKPTGKHYDIDKILEEMKE